MFSEQQLMQLKEAETKTAESKKIKEKLSKLLGIPEYEIVDPNIFRAASLFGLLKGEGGGSLFDVFSTEAQADKGCYKNYTAFPVTTEHAKLKSLQHVLVKKTSGFAQWISETVVERTKTLLEKDIFVPTDDKTFQGFQNACIEAVECYETCLEETNEESSDGSWILEKLAALRDALFGFMDLVSIIRLAKQHTLMARKKNVTSALGLNPYEMFVFGVDYGAPVDATLVERALLINHYTRDPKLAPFSMNLFIKRCCNPSLLFCPLEKVLEYQMFEPYFNNNIGYHRGTRLFYILYDIKNGKRYWIADPNLSVLITKIGETLVCFMYKTFRQLFKNVFGTNVFKSSRKHPRHAEFLTLIRNWKLAKNTVLLGDIVKSLTRLYAEIYATDLDFFDIVDDNKIKEIPLKHVKCLPLYDLPLRDDGWSKL